MAAFRFESPYADVTSVRWLRGNHHGHSTLSDGSETPEQLIEAYAAAGYDYLALSEHDLFVDPAHYPNAPLCLVPAVEVTSDAGHTLMHLGATDAMPARTLSPRQIMERAEADGGLFVFDHPNWTPVVDYATDDLLFSMEGMRGMEIYCGVIERLSGVACATDRWDRLLSRGWRVWGHATDDQHVPSDRFIGWNCVQWPSHEPVAAKGIVEALARGRFVASTGVTIHGVGVDGAEAFVDSDADEVRWIGHGGQILQKDRAGRSRIDVATVAERTTVGPAGDTRYVRAECFGGGSTMAWTQPFHVVAA